MAEEKKDAKKDDKKPAKKKGITWEDVVLLMLGLVTIFFVIIPQFAPPAEIVLDKNGQPIESILSSQPATKGLGGIYNRIFGQGVDAEGQTTSLQEAKFRITDFISGAFTFVAILSVFLSALFALFWYYNKLRVELITNTYVKSLGMKPEIFIEKKPDMNTIPANYVPDTNGLRNPKWELVEKYYNSGNPSDWRVAIIEADILLFEVLQSSGFPGETIGEMLKGSNTAQLQNLQTAWKSHLIRNRLAHEGASIPLSRQTVEVAIEGYKTVFTELNYI